MPHYYLPKTERKTYVDPNYRSAIPEIRNFHQTLEDYSVTPLKLMVQMAKKYGLGKILLKDESSRLGLNAFKALGVFYAIHKLAGKGTLCSATDGNHGRALAHVAQKMNLPCKIYVPEYTVKYRIEALEIFGAQVQVVPGNYDETVKLAYQDAIKNKWDFVQDFGWKGYSDIPTTIMMGYSTQFYEVLESVGAKSDPGFDILFLQAGCGGWAASAVMFFDTFFPKNNIKVVIVEPEASDCLYQSGINNRLSKTLGSEETIMAGLNCTLPSEPAWEILKDRVDAYIKISDFWTKRAMQELYFPDGDDPLVIAGESGAAGIAALIAIAETPDLNTLKKFLDWNPNSRVLAINTEGDTDPHSFSKIIAEKINNQN